MNIFTNLEIANAIYAAEIASGEISANTRNEVSINATSVDSYVAILDIILNFLRTNIANNTINEEEAIDFLENEYELLNFSEKFYPFDFIKPICTIVFQRDVLLQKSDEERVEFIKTIYNSIKNCEMEEFRNGILLLLTKIVLVFDIINKDLELGIALINDVKNLSEQQKKDALIPYTWYRL